MTTICKSIFSNEVYTFWLKSLQFVPKGTVDYKSKLVQAMAWHQAITWVRDDPGLWCLYASLRFIGLITSPCWEIYSDEMRRNTVLLEHTRDAFTVTPQLPKSKYQFICIKIPLPGFLMYLFGRVFLYICHFFNWRFVASLADIVYFCMGDMIDRCVRSSDNTSNGIHNSTSISFSISGISISGISGIGLRTSGDKKICDKWKIPTNFREGPVKRIVSDRCRHLYDDVILIVDVVFSCRRNR